MYIFKSKFLLTIFIINFVILSVFNNILAAIYEYPLTRSTESKLKTDQSSISIETIADIKPEFKFQSVSQVLMEPITGKIIYANNENEKLLPASVTKIMSLILIMENIDGGKIKYTDTVTCSVNASKMGGSQIWFKEGEKLTITDALKCICMASANDVTVAMAEMIGGSESNFVKMMNDKANELNMTNTVFKNSHGIDEDGHYTTALDIAIMSRELIVKHPDILKYTSIWMDSIRQGTFGLTNTNKLIRFYDGAVGLKTGSTSKALFNLSAVAKKSNTMLISVILKAPSSDIRNDEAKQLLDYGFSNFEMTKIMSNNDVVTDIVLNKYIDSKVPVKINQDLGFIGVKNEKIEFEKVIKINENLSAPIEENTVVGKLEIISKVSKEVLTTGDIIIDTKIEKSNFINYFKHIIKKSMLII